MANIALRQAFELETRNKYTKVNCDITLKVDGREMPTMAVLGAALEEAIELIQNHITESYKVIPPRVNAPETPIAVPAQATPTVAETPAPVNDEVLVELKPWEIR